MGLQNSLMLTLVIMSAGAHAGSMAVDESLKFASSAYFECLRDRTRAIDDGISDAGTVGNAIIRHCRMRQWRSLMAAGGDAVVFSYLAEEPNAREVYTVIDFVLWERSRRLDKKK